jgi:N-acyl-D-aspartate/D-glutamate deacylase
LPSGVRKLTSEPARVFGIRNRGALKPGYHADLLLFDPSTVGRGPRHQVNDLPGGHARLTTEPRGVHGVWVNGAAPESLPGTLLRDFA